MFYPSFEDVDGEIDDLIAYFEQKLTLDSCFPKICSPELDLTQVHISGWNGFLFKPTVCLAVSCSTMLLSASCLLCVQLCQGKS